VSSPQTPGSQSYLPSSSEFFWTPKSTNNPPYSTEHSTRQWPSISDRYSKHLCSLSLSTPEIPWGPGQLGNLSSPSSQLSSGFTPLSLSFPISKVGRTTKLTPQSSCMKQVIALDLLCVSWSCCFYSSALFYFRLPSLPWIAWQYF